MQPSIEHIPEDTGSSFRCSRFETDGFPFQWHLHPEIELTLITAGRGQRYVGDHMEDFSPGDLVLLGPNLPHTWHSAEPSRSLVVQFRTDFLGAAFFKTPELRAVHRLLEQSAVGLIFAGTTARSVGQTLTTLPELPPLRRATALLDALDALSHLPQARRLASKPLTPRLRPQDQRRIDRVCQQIHQHYTEPITQTEMADRLSLSGPAFARFFKKMTGQTFVDYVHRLRVAHACRLLIETDRPVTDICFDAGFGNVSNFNRVFRRLKGTPPRTFRQHFTPREVLPTRPRA